jgi:hypothetical protein
MVVTTPQTTYKLCAEFVTPSKPLWHKTIWLALEKPADQLHPCMVDRFNHLCYNTSMQKGTEVEVVWADRVGTVRNIRLDDASEAIITVEFADGELIVARPSELRKV